MRHLVILLKPNLYKQTHLSCTPRKILQRICQLRSTHSAAHSVHFVCVIHTRTHAHSERESLGERERECVGEQRSVKMS